MSLPPYASYRASGAEFLGDVPAHWEVRRLKSVLAEPLKYGANEAADADTPDWPRFVRITDIDGRGELREETFRSLNPALAEPYLLRDGDLLLARSGATVGKSFLYHRSWGKCCFAGYLIRARPDERIVDHRFLSYCCKSDFYWNYVGSDQIQSTIQNFSAEKYASLWLSIPAKVEQAAIANFLDRETGKIDALVGEQWRLVDLLKEKRQAVISHAVTKGLDSTAAMKNSGADWLGDVPAHWQVTKLKHLTSLKSGGTPSKDNLGYWSGDIPWASAKDLKSDDLADTIDHITEAAVADGAAQLAPPGSVVVLVRGMMLARTFPVVRILVPMAINQDLKALNGRQGVSNEYLAWLLRGTAPETLNRLDEAGHGTKALRMEAWLSMPVPLPPLAEQERIVAFIRTELGKLDALVTVAATAVTLLQERRSALISAAVTGRIDVRGLAPAEAEAA